MTLEAEAVEIATASATRKR